MKTIIDLQIGSPIYYVDIDKITISKITGLEKGNSNIIIKAHCNRFGHMQGEAEFDKTEVEVENHYWVHPKVAYLNIEDAELSQLMMRSEYVEAAKQRMEKAQEEFAKAIQQYAFAEPSKPTEE